MTNLLIVLFIVIFVLFLFVQMNRYYREQEVVRVENILQNGLDNVSSQLDTLRNQLTQTKFYDNLRKIALISQELQPSDYISLRNVQNSLNIITAANGGFSDIVVYFSRSGVVLSRHHVFISIEDFYKQYHSEKMNMEELFHLPPPGHLTFDFFPGGVIKAIGQPEAQAAFVYRIPLSAPDIVQTYSYAYLFFSQEVFQSLLSPLDMEEYQSLILVDKAGNRLYDYGEIEKPIEGKNVIEVKNNIGSLTIKGVLCEEYFSTVLKKVKVFINVGFILVILAGVLVAFFAAWRQSQPIRKLIAGFSDEGLTGGLGQQNEYQWLENNLAQLNRENENALEQLNQYQQQSQNNLFEKLLMGTISGQEKRGKGAELIKTLSSPFVVGYGKFQFPFPLESATAQDARNLIVSEKIKKILPENSYFYFLEEETFALVLSYEEDLEETVKKFEQALAVFDNEQSHEIRLVLSPPLTKIEEISWSYEKIKSYYSFTSGPKIIHFLPKEIEKEEQRYTLRNLQKLYDYICAGELNEGKKQLKQLIYSPYEPGTTLKQRFHMIRGLLLLCTSAMELDNQLVKELKYNSFDDNLSIENKISKAMEDLAKQIEGKNLTKRDRRVEEMLGYMNEHFTEKEFSPTTLAQAFSISEKHLYTLLKEGVNTTPAAYLLDLRLDYAAKLLMETQQTVQEVSQQAGFYNFNTFYKAFKRAYGLTPTKYREREKSENSKE